MKKPVSITLTEEQKKKLTRIEKQISQMRGGGAYAVFAQIHYPTGEMRVCLVRGERAHIIREMLREALK